jgi:prepilin-type N-terminal cleavage/methylation domain-containing protein
VNKDRGFNLLELIVVLIIIGILAILAVPQFQVAKEKALDREVQANLKLIQAAEKISHMESTVYPTGSIVDTRAKINAVLFLDIPATTDWDYSVDDTSVPFRVRAQRTSGDIRVWCIRKDDAKPESNTSVPAPAWCN